MPTNETLPRRAQRVLRSIRQSVPSGVYLGRTSAGEGPVEFIPIAEAQNDLGGPGSSSFNFYADNPLSGTAFDSTTTTWERYAQFRPVEPHPPKLERYCDEFATSRGNYTELTANGTVSATAFDASINITATSGFPFSLFTSPHRPDGPVMSMQLDVEAFSGGTYNIAVGGFVEDIDNFVIFECDHVGGDARIVQRTGGGAFTTLATLAAFPYTFPYTVTLSMVGSGVSLYIDRGSGPNHVASATQTALDPTNPEDIRYAFGVSLQTSGSLVRVTRAAGGTGGHISIRDINLVTYDTGAPIQVDNYYYFTASVSEPGGFGYWAMFRFNLTSYKVEQTGTLLFEVSGAVEARLPGHVVFDQTAKTWRIFVSGFGFRAAPGNPSAGVTMYTTDDWLLEGHYVLKNGTDLSLPLGAGGAAAYDPAVVRPAGSTEWKIGYAITESLTFSPENFYPAIATTEDFSSFTLVAADTGQSACEGTKWMQTGGSLRLFAATRTNVRVYDDGLNLQGTITGLDTSASPVSPLHFMPVPLRRNGETEWLGLQFNGQRFRNNALFTWGDIVVWRASTTQPGYEYPRQQFVPYR